MAVKEKRVELTELFYDLIYVYAISRLAMLIEESEGGINPAFRILSISGGLFCYSSGLALPDQLRKPLKGEANV